jgi:hypothetical protein
MRIKTHPIQLRRGLDGEPALRTRARARGLVTPTDLARHLGLHASTVRRVLGDQAAPGTDLIAAAISRLDAEFADLFEVVTQQS